jgi:hypothetical protein
MTNTTKRNLQGSIVCFLLSCLIGGMGVAVMMLREAWQSKKYGFAVERDDIVRYSTIGAIGSVVNIGLLLIV